MHNESGLITIIPPESPELTFTLWLIPVGKFIGICYVCS